MANVYQQISRLLSITTSMKLDNKQVSIINQLRLTEIFFMGIHSWWLQFNFDNTSSARKRYPWANAVQVSQFIGDLFVFMHNNARPDGQDSQNRSSQYSQKDWPGRRHAGRYTVYLWEHMKLTTTEKVMLSDAIILWELCSVSLCWQIFSILVLIIIGLLDYKKEIKWFNKYSEV